MKYYEKEWSKILEKYLVFIFKTSFFSWKWFWTKGPRTSTSPWWLPWCQPPLNISTPPPPPSPTTLAPPFIRNIICIPFSTFLEQKSLFLNLLISFIKSIKTSDFSHYVSHVMTLWYNTWKHTTINILQYSISHKQVIKDNLFM